MSVKLSLTVRPSGDRFLQLISPRFNTLVDTPLATEPRKSTATLTTENKGYGSSFHRVKVWKFLSVFLIVHNTKMVPVARPIGLEYAKLKYHYNITELYHSICR
ncbi:hypothetical protein CDAR_194901 [Caerostris darwini]|uniref:Uncharacterized protein n=1 Tax=Caerostris darwini TaxID=1538125 RepID=A0AAV4X5K1_9ARAC|nr:hypothetical protein CDAR_194901 [Caerostris darwini]